MADPPEIAAPCSFDFVRPRLPPPPARVLEVGCGQGHLSALLAAEGYRVVALDASPEAVELARRRGVDAHRAEWRTFEASPFDALLFPRVLHRLDPLEEAVQRARTLLAPGGTMIVEDFASELSDASTLEWLRAVTTLLARASALRAPSGSLLSRVLAADDGYRAWADHHRAFAPMHSSAAMEGALRRCFPSVVADEAPHLFRYFPRALSSDAGGAALLSSLIEAERRAIATSMIRPAGRRFVCGS